MSRGALYRALGGLMKKTHGLTVLVFTIVLGILLLTLESSTGERRLQDSFYQKGMDVDARIIIVGVDEETLEYCGRWPFDRNYHADLLKKLNSGNPAAVFMDFIFAESEANDALFSQAMNPESTIIPAYGRMEAFSRSDELLVEQWLYPPSLLKERSILAHINTIPDDDGVIRHGVTGLNAPEGQIPSVSQKIIELVESREGSSLMAQVPKDPLGRFYIKYAGGPGTYPYISYQQILKDEIPVEYFEDAIVLVGPYAVGIGDYYFTSIDHQAPMYGVEIHANMVNQILFQDFSEYASIWRVYVGVILLGVLLYYLCFKLKPLYATLVFFGFIMAYLALASWGAQKGLLLPILAVLLSFSMLYVFTLAYKYILERIERKRITGMFSRYVAPQIVQEVIKQGDQVKLGGERKEIAVLFVDIRGFTPLSEKATPEEVVEILNAYLTLCANSIFECGGTLDKFIGDATMAFFNAPIDQDNYVYQAVKAAWLMKEGAKPLEEKLFEKFGKRVQFGIGVNTGPAVIGNIGADFRMDYTAIGDTVNTAARLESNAKAGQILISEAVYHRIENDIEATPLGEYQVKGKTEKINVFQVESIMKGGNNVAN